MNKNIAIIGSGSWGVALGNHLAELGNKVKIWSFTEDEKNMINNGVKNGYEKFFVSANPEHFKTASSVFYPLEDLPTLI